MSDLFVRQYSKQSLPFFRFFQIVERNVYAFQLLDNFFDKSWTVGILGSVSGPFAVDAESGP